MAQQALKSAYGQSPSSLAQPVPNEDELNAAAQAFLAQSEQAASAGAQLNQASAQTAPPTDDINAAAQAFLQSDDSAAPEASLPTEAPMVDEGGASWITQLKAGLAANDTEKENFLRAQYGEGNVRKKDGELYYSTDGKKFKKFDTTLINDFVDAFLPTPRTLVQEAAMLPGEVVGGLTGGAVSAGAGAPAGALAGRVASVPVANRLADELAKWVGIPQDPSRKKEMENGVGMAVEAVAPVVGRIAGGGVKKLAARIPGTSAFAERKGKELAKDVFALTDESRALIDDLNFLKQEGISVEMLNPQISPTSEPLKAAQKKIQSSKEFADAQVRVAQKAQEAIQATAALAFDAKKAAKAADGRVGERVLDATADLLKSEGAEIGKFKARAAAATKNAKFPLSPEVTQRVTGLLGELDLNPQLLGKVTSKDLQERLGKFGINETGQLRSFVNALNTFSKQSTGGLRVTEIDEALKTLDHMRPTANRVGGQLRREWNGMMSDLRAHKNRIIEAALPDEADKQIFRRVNGEYGKRLEAVGNIQELISNDMGSHIVVDKLFSKGAEGLGDLQALKYVLKDGNSELWERLKGDWMTRQLELARTSTTKQATGFNADSFLKTLKTKYGPEFMGEIFDDPKQLKQFEASLRIADRINKTSVGITTKPDDKLVNELSQSILGSSFLKARAVLSMFKRGSKETDNALAAVLSQNGFDRYIAGLPKSKKGPFAARIGELYDEAVKTGMIIPRTVREAPRNALERSVRGNVRNYMSETGGEEPLLEEAP